MTRQFCIQKYICNKLFNKGPKYIHLKKSMFILCIFLLVVSMTACQKETLPEKPDDLYGNYYEIFVASFYDSDNDGMGDIAGIVQKMDYLNDNSTKTQEDLMIDGLWLMPIMPSPSYHKYDVMDYKAIDPAYGSIEDFQKLMEVTDEAGVRVIIDLVVNHSSVEHPWFKEAVKGLEGEANKYVDYYSFVNESGKTNYHQVQGITGYYYEGVFGPHMPDLNLDNEDVREEILDIANFWIDLGVDGFRLDAVTHYYEGNNQENVEFLSWFNDEMKKINEDIYVVGEAWSDAGTIKTLYNSGIDSFFNFPFSGGKGDIIMKIKTKKGAALAEDIENWQKDRMESNPTSIDAVFLSNHDNARSGGALNRDLTLQKLGANVYMLMPGNSFIYYGEEIAMYGSGRDENKRQPLLWSVNDSTGLTNPPIGSETVAPPEQGIYEQLSDDESLLNHYKKLLLIKRKYPEIARGLVSVIKTEQSEICAYETTWEKEGQESSIAVFHNFSDEEIIISNLDYKELLEDLSRGESGAVYKDGELIIPGMSTVLLK